MRTAVRIGVSVAGGAMIVLALVGLAYTWWGLMTPMFAILDPFPVGLTSVAALLSGVGLLALRRRLTTVSASSDIAAR